MSMTELMLREQSRIPLWFPVLVGCGIAFYFAMPAPTPFWLYAAGAALAACLCVPAWKYAAPRIVLLIAFSLLLGMAASALRLHWVAAPVLRTPVFFKMVEGTVEDIQHKENKVKLVLAGPLIETLAAKDTPVRISVTLKSLDAPLAIGQRVRFPAMLFPPPAPAMPGAYDFARMFYFQQLGAVGFSPRQPEILSATQAQGSITALRLAISDHLVAVMGQEYGAIASALMVGEQSRVSQEVTDSMRESGIYHILSISGLHMSLATGLLFFTVRLLLVMIPTCALHWPVKKIAAVCGLLGGLAYLLLAGSPVPAVRSYIMVACVLGAVLIDRKGISMYSLSWAATLILLLMPESLFTASFQLTFAATLAIVALYERYGNYLFRANAGIAGRTGLYFLGLMLTSLAASLYTSPLAIAHFNRMAIYGVVANMLIVPLSSFWIMPAAMLAMLAMPFGWDAPFLYLLKIGLEWMMAGSRLVSHFPYANIALPAPSDAGFLLMVAGGLWCALWITRIRFAGLLMVAAGLATIASFTPYDLIVSDDAKRIAYFSESGQWVMLRGDVDSFESEIWLRMQGKEAMISRKQARQAIPELQCDKTTCQITRSDQTIVMAIRKDPKARLCESGAEVVISDQYLHCDAIPMVIDRDFVEKNGAAALRFADGVIELASTQHARGHWPWAQGPTHDDHRTTETPESPPAP